MAQGKGARARQKAKRAEYLKNRPYWGFTCKGCKHEDVMHFFFVGKCSRKDCDCSGMNDIKGEKMSFAETYKNHAYFELIDEAEKQGISYGVEVEQSRIINLLLDQNIIRRCAATNKLVGFNTHGTEVVYIKNLEQS